MYLLNFMHSSAGHDNGNRCSYRNLSWRITYTIYFAVSEV